MFTSHVPADSTDAARWRLHSGITMLAIACTLFGIVFACRATEYCRCRIVVRARPIERQQSAKEGRVWWRRRSLEQCILAVRRSAGNRGNGREAAGMHSVADLEGGAEMLSLTEERCRSTPCDIARPQPVHRASSESRPTEPGPVRERLPEAIASAKPKPWPTYSLFPRVDDFPGPTTIAAPPCVYIMG